MYNGRFEKESLTAHALSMVSPRLVKTTRTILLCVLKTKMQLEMVPLLYKKVVTDICRADVVPGFYKGLTASYAGSLETAIYFVLHKKLK